MANKSLLPSSLLPSLGFPLWVSLAPVLFLAVPLTPAADFTGRHFAGAGDTDYLQLLETSARFFHPDPQYPNLPMLYTPQWDGLVEGPTWDAWWIQNSYGTTYCALPFLTEPYTTFLQHSQDLWFDHIGDGHRKGAHDWVAPDGCLCDCASPTQVYYKQGDGRIDIHDWALEFTAAGVLLQSELLLISRDGQAIAHYLPLLERSANFIETRRDPNNNLFLAGPAANLLGPSYAGYKKPDGSYGNAYLTGLSITYIAALDRLIELEKLAHHGDRAATYTTRRDTAQSALPQLTTQEGYFIRSLDPDGAKHGVYGAKTHGYFETPPNHDAIAFHVVDLAQSEKIYQKIASIPQLRPHAFILPNYPAYDDLYLTPTDALWSYGTWVNGGHWSTCEARMILAYARLNHFDDIRASHAQLMKFATAFRMDNPLTQMGNAVYQPNQPINLCYDTFAPAAAAIRGLFEYLYQSDRLILIPHIPPKLTELDQLDPIRWGDKRLLLSTAGAGPVTAVTVNGQPLKTFTPTAITLPYTDLPDDAILEISLGQATCKRPPILPAAPHDRPGAYARFARFAQALEAADLGDTYEAAHARLIVQSATAATDRADALATGDLAPLPDAKSEAAADQAYTDTPRKLAQGLTTVIESYRRSNDETKKTIVRLWDATR